MNITYEELQLMAIFNAGSRESTIAALEKMSTELEPDETELRELTISALEKLRTMADAEFKALDLIPDFAN